MAIEEKYGVIEAINKKNIETYVYNILGFEIPILYNKHHRYFNDFSSKSVFITDKNGELINLVQTINIGLESIKEKMLTQRFIPNRLSKLVIDDPNKEFTDEDEPMIRYELLRCVSACLVHECGHIITLRDLYNRSSNTSEYERLLEENETGYLKLLETNPVTDLASQLEFSRLYYNLPLEIMANERMGISFMDI